MLIDTTVGIMKEDQKLLITNHLDQSIYLVNQ
jgi:hypothetical protein